MIKLYLDVSEVIHVKEYAKYANCGLHVNLEFFVNAILFHDEKRIILSRNCYYGLQSPLSNLRFVKCT